MLKAFKLILVVCWVCACGGLHIAGAQNLTYQDIEKLPVPPADHRISYGLDPEQFGELRLPGGRGPHPVAVIIHGGCWYAEYNIKHVGNFAAALTKTGVATWTLEYRRVGNPGGGWPGTFEDVARGTDSLRSFARTHRLDLKRVVVVGHSAGGQLALWLASRRHLPRGNVLYAPKPLPIRGVVSLAGIIDMSAFGQRCGGTLFLDEVQAMSWSNQERLLRLIMQGVIERVRTARRPVRVDVRVVAGTSCDLSAKVVSGLFLPKLLEALSVSGMLSTPSPKDLEEMSMLSGCLVKESLECCYPEGAKLPDAVAWLLRARSQCRWRVGAAVSPHVCPSCLTGRILSRPNQSDR